MKTPRLHFRKQQQSNTIAALGIISILAAPLLVYAEGDLAEESMNPLSTINSLPFENNTLFNLGPSGSTANVLNIKPIFPVDMGDWILLNRAIVPLVYTQGQDEIVSDRFSWGSGNPGSFSIGSTFGLGDITYQGFIRPKKTGKYSMGLGDQLSCQRIRKIGLAPTSGLQDPRSWRLLL